MHGAAFDELDRSQKLRKRSWGELRCRTLHDNRPDDELESWRLVSTALSLALGITHGGIHNCGGISQSVGKGIGGNNGRTTFPDRPPPMEMLRIQREATQIALDYS